MFGSRRPSDGGRRWHDYDNHTTTMEGNDHEMARETVPFTENDVMEYLDGCIDFWREKKTIAEANVDAFQSVRTSLFGELKD